MLVPWEGRSQTISGASLFPLRGRLNGLDRAVGQAFGEPGEWLFQPPKPYAHVILFQRSISLSTGSMDAKQ